MESPTRPLALAILLHALVQSVSATVTFPSIQPIVGFSSSCTLAYNTPVSNCNANDFSGIGGSGSCSTACEAALINAQILVQSLCQGQVAAGNTVIGQLFRGSIVDFLCDDDNTATTTAAATQASTPAASTMSMATDTTSAATSVQTISTTVVTTPSSMSASETTSTSSSSSSKTTETSSSTFSSIPTSVESATSSRTSESLTSSTSTSATATATSQSSSGGGGGGGSSGSGGGSPFDGQFVINSAGKKTQSHMLLLSSLGALMFAIF